MLQVTFSPVVCNYTLYFLVKYDDMILYGKLPIIYRL